MAIHSDVEFCYCFIRVLNLAISYEIHAAPYVFTGVILISVAINGIMLDSNNYF